MGSRLNRKFLKAIAEAYIERPVFVDTLPEGGPFWGRADYEGCYVIRLDMSRKGFPHTFFHEVGHIVLGHVPDEVIEGRRHTPDDIDREIVHGLEPEVWRSIRAKLADMDKEADEWADIQLPICEAACLEVGMTFLDLAIIRGDEHD